MSRRYYCDYCDKSFIETPEAVKKHIKGLQHQNLKSEHYSQFQDKRIILENESKKITCKRFVEFGYCMFGTTCRYSHYTKHQLDTLRWEVDGMHRFSYIQNEQNVASNSTVRDWLISRRKRNLSNSKLLNEEFIHTSVANDDFSNMMGWKYPSFINNIPNLPPSLKKLRVSDLNDNNFAIWG
ncbi:zinc finger matrin-type protein 5 [Arctopsyche grandis]|uniref:zinc finger matrin-type protein 5 n=1 Tax=Arctopsyche grandis TaxID=121162 RepID=UPI00406D9143